MPKNPTEFLRCDFTDSQIADFARELARANRQRATIEQRKKEVTKQLSAEIEAENSEIQRLSRYISEGFEYREVDCRVELDVPELGKKTYFRLDTSEIVKVVPMTDNDKQIPLDLNAGKEVVTTEPGEMATEVVAAAAVAAAGPTLAPAALSGGTHQKGSKQRDGRRKPRDPDAEAIADGTAPEETDPDTIQ